MPNPETGLTALETTRVVSLFDALRASPDGLDVHQIGAALGLDSTRQRGAIFAVIRKLRLYLGEQNDDPNALMHGFSVPIRHEGRRRIYVLSARRDEGSDWQHVRASTVESRLKVDVAHWQAMVSNTDGRTLEGRIARAYVRHFTRLLEDVQSIKAEGF